MSDAFNALLAKFAYYTEVELATLEHLRTRRSGSLSEVRRHIRIAKGMIEVCRTNWKSGEPVSEHAYPRLKQYLDAALEVGDHVYTAYENGQLTNHNERPK